MRDYEKLIAKRDEEGNPKVYLNAALDMLYDDLFRKARRSVRRDPWNIENGIRSVIFGCFLIEARSNTVLRELLPITIKGPLLASRVWESVKRANIHSKLELLAPFASERVRTNAQELFPRVKRVFDLRNRLAHFKDENVLLGELEEARDFVDMINNTPRPSVLAELEHPKIEEHLSALTDANLWINYIHRRHFKFGPLTTIGETAEPER